ncbi:flagellar protein FliT [Cupriavidus pinatubonensis]|uniref:flagellar protein FliT n=1 Tax=Cupriavidus pinatubonensis TaxID=248026 RepID=UPI001CC6A2E5
MNSLQCIYLREVERLRLMDRSVPISEQERGRRYKHLARILACDAAIRDLLAPVSVRNLTPR